MKSFASISILWLYTVLLFLSLTVIPKALAQEHSTWVDGTPKAVEIYRKLDTIDLIDSVRMAPNAQVPPKLGSKRSFFSIDFFRERVYSVNATLQLIGDFCYIYVEDSQWNRSVDASGVELIRGAFEVSSPADRLRGIYQIETAAFGLPPDEIDKDNKIYILIMDIIDGLGGDSFVGGYFNPVNQRAGILRHPELGMFFRSNEVEMVYIDSQPLDIKSQRAKAVLAHEFQHLIQWGNDPDEEIWVNEGCSEYATFLCGYKVESVRSFSLSPNISLTNWPKSSASGSEYYGASYLFMLYLHERYGGTKSVAAVVKERQNGILGINSALKKLGFSNAFHEIFSDWKLANLIDDVAFESGKYGYIAEDVKLKLPPEINVFPFPKTEGRNRTWATTYLIFSASGLKKDLQVNFFSNPNLPFDLRIVGFRSGKVALIDRISLDIKTGLGQAVVRDFGGNVDRVALAISPLPAQNLGQNQDFSSYSVSAMFSGGVSFSSALIPNPVHSRYFDIILLPSVELGAELPLISILRDGLVVLSQTHMRPVNDGKSYAYTLYIPIEDLDSEVSWRITYQGETFVAEGVKPSEVIAKYHSPIAKDKSVGVALGANFPDPFNLETWIPFKLGQTSQVEITVYDSAGKLVRRLNLGVKSAGSYSDKSSAARWDGKNEFGEYVSSGAYFYRIKADGFTAVRRMILIK